MNHFVFTGPESSGKTTLALAVAKLSKGVFVKEVAREYLAALGVNYKKSDLLEIAKLQFKVQEEAKKTNKQCLCFDTDLITIKIWSEYKYGSCDPWIEEKIKFNKDVIYILCQPDIPWEEDPLRENPNDREELYGIYRAYLVTIGVKFIEVGGSVEKRVEKIKDATPFFKGIAS